MYCIIYRRNDRSIAVYGPFASIKEADDNVEDVLYPLFHEDEEKNSERDYKEGVHRPMHNFDIVPFQHMPNAASA